LKIYQSLKIETQSKSIQNILKQREIDLQIPGELSKEKELQNEIGKCIQAQLKQQKTVGI